MRAVIALSLALGTMLGGVNAVDAQSVMKQCGDQWQAAKSAGTTNGETWPQFLAQCRTNLKTAGMGGAAPSGAPTPAPVAPAPSAAPAPMAGKTVAECDAEYAANKAAIRAGGQTKRAFVAACRAGNETIPQGAAAAPAPAPIPAPTSTSTGSLFPWQQPATPGPAPAPASYGTPAPTGAGQFASAPEAQSRCPGATVVWVNTSSRVYHFAGNRNYGNTKRGAYMCEADAQASGNRAAKNESHP